MRVVERISEIGTRGQNSVGFVPTMGALHEGHATLLRRSRAENDISVLSIFVNPTQFGPNEDYSRYPRTLESDLAIAESCGVDIVFLPSVEEMYPNHLVKVQVFGVTERWEGAKRPGHFDGVSTVVAKLFGMVLPTRAYFGQKDLQQCQVVQTMVTGLNLPIGVVVCDTVREVDGLAMSSRNRYLSPSERNLAPLLYQKLSESRMSIVQGSSVAETLSSAVSALSANGFGVDYFEYVDLPTMAPIAAHQQDSALICAAKLGTTRLIDNVVFLS